jgi:uncharacterized membrane protein
MSETVSSGPATPKSSEETLVGVAGYVLLLAAPFTFGVTALAAVALAYARRPFASTPVHSHYGFQLRIFWVGLILALLSAAVLVFGAGSLYQDVMASLNHQPPDGSIIPLPDENAVKLRPVGVLSLMAGGALALATMAWLIVTSIFGLVRLASGRPVGRVG